MQRPQLECELPHERQVLSHILKQLEALLVVDESALEGRLAQ